MSKLLFEEESYTIIGSLLEIHKRLGAGFTEDVYHEILQKEFTF